ncbi:MAG: signal peptidase II [Lachnospiraceae bacterium]|nr:signal peptidase II [Lachnospiraceae bacterium]
MFGFLTLGTTMAMTDLAFKNRIDSQKDEEFPKELTGSKGKILLYKNHNDGFSFGVLRGSRLVELVPLCLTSGIAGVWTYLMSVRGRWAEKIAMTFVLAGGVSNLIDRLTKGYVIDYICVQWKALKKVVFNLADVFIMIGCGLLVLANVADLIKGKLKHKK